MLIYTYRRGVLELLVSTTWAIPRASDRGASNGSSLHAFFYMAYSVFIFSAESGVYRLLLQNEVE